MNHECRAMGFVATSAGRRLLRVSRGEATAAGGRVVVTATSSTNKTRAGVSVRILRVLLR